ncbi:MAG: MFS transporter [Thermomicrobiales bacterium]
MTTPSLSSEQAIGVTTLTRPDGATAQPTTERRVIVAIALGTMLAPLNSTMIAVALPRIIQDFHVRVATAGWLVTTYLIAMASLQPVAGKLGDRLGRRRLILGGLIYFGVASLGATLATNLPLLFFFRVQQAVAGAIALPNGTALVRDLVPLDRRARSFGMIGSATAFAAALGPPIGGVLVQTLGWRSIFFVNVPLVLAAVLFGWRAIPTTHTERGSRGFDVVGACLLSVVLIGLTVLLTLSKRAESALLPTLGGLALLGLGAVFIRYEARHPDPVLQPRFFRVRSFAAANGAIALSNLAMYSTLLTVPILLSRRGGWSSAKVGVLLVMLSGAMVVCSPLGGRLADRVGRRWPTVIGLALLTLGVLPLALAGGGIAIPLLLGGLGVAGVGLGLSSAGMQTAAIEAVGPREAGVAAGVFSTSRYLGSIVGSSLLAGLLGAAGSGGFRMVFVMVAAAALLSALVALVLRDHPAEAIGSGR